MGLGQYRRDGNEVLKTGDSRKKAQKTQKRKGRKSAERNKKSKKGQKYKFDCNLLTWIWL